MKLKQLESILGSLKSFENPKVNLEQYQTGSEIAAAIFHAMSFGDDVRDKVVVDLGCGCGTLAIGASLLGARHCFGIDIDEDAISICMGNVNDLELDNIDLINCDVVTAIPSLVRDQFVGSFDVALMNPPFGTKNNEGIDLKFLRAAVDLGCRTIYSMHKSSTRQFLLKKAHELNLKAEPFAQLRFDLPATMRFHKRKNVDIEVDLIRYERRS